nr:hypothetical protein FVER53263_11742 [Fusarium verticillioides]
MDAITPVSFTKSTRIWRGKSRNISDTDAATYGVSAVTAMLVLNVIHGIPFIDTKRLSPKDEAIFIYSGSTSLVKQYGADAVFDYNSPSVAEDIIKEYPKITKAVDCFSEGKSTSVCADVLEPNGGKVVTLLPNGKSSTPGVTYDLVMSYTAMGHAFQWLPPIGPKFEARPQDRAALVRFYETLPQITHILKPIPTIELKSGFDGIFEGLDKLRAGQVAGGKLVVRSNAEEQQMAIEALAVILDDILRRIELSVKTFIFYT